MVLALRNPPLFVAAQPNCVCRSWRSDAVPRSR